jgi:prepilin signal peptidase PulO-like enzyme (type II secretory pathway)
MWFFIVGLITTFIFFYICWGIPYLAWHPLSVIVLLIFLIIIVGLVLKKMSGNFILWHDGHRVALCTGLLGFLVFLSIIVEMNGIFGQAAVALVICLFLAKVNFDVRKRMNAGNI